MDERLPAYAIFKSLRQLEGRVHAHHMLGAAREHVLYNLLKALWAQCNTAFHQLKHMNDNGDLTLV